MNPNPTKPVKGRWKPGESGNPAGKPPGALNASTKLRKMINVEKIIARLQQAAEGGDVQAARTLLERALPIYRTTTAPVELPELASAQELTDKALSVLDAVADGRMPPDVGSQLVSAIGAVASLSKADDLARRIAALEQRNGKS
jgi:hypothetical protein